MRSTRREAEKEKERPPPKDKGEAKETKKRMGSLNSSPLLALARLALGLRPLERGRSSVDNALGALVGRAEASRRARGRGADASH